LYDVSVPHLYQQFIVASRGKDVRVIVVGGQAVAAMQRESDTDFRANIELGGHGYQIDLPDSFKRAAERCAEILKLDFCGVDILYGENDEPIICEVNSNALVGRIQRTTGINIAKLYADYICEQMAITTPGT
jgi:RimK family alpha-L-glutamate ligase